MPTCRTLALLSLFVLVVRPAGAQRISHATVVDTIDVVSATPGIETRLLLDGSGARVKVISPNHVVSADTLAVMTPVRLVLPIERLTLAVTAALAERGAQTVIIRTAGSRSAKPQYASTFYSPFDLSRASVGAALIINASRMSATRIP